MAPPGTAQRNGLRRRRKEKRKDHLPGPRTNASEGRATCYLSGRTPRPQGRPGGRTGRAFPASAAHGLAGATDRPGAAVRSSSTSARLRGGRASELRNPEGQNGLSRPPPPSQLTAVHCGAPRPVPLSCEDRLRPPPVPLRPDREAVTCAAGGGPDAARMRRMRVRPPGRVLGSLEDLFRTG